MRKNTSYTYGLENESIIVDIHWIPQYLIEGQKTSTKIIEIFQIKYPELKNIIKPELDACQIELINPKPHTSLESATEEILEGLYKTNNIIKEFWLYISEDVAPKTDWPCITSDSPYPEITTRYEKIGKMLEELWVRASTNIAGLHINIWHKNNNHLLKIHKKISEKIYEILEKERGILHMHPERYKKYTEVTDILDWNHLPLLVNKYTEYLDKQGNPIPQWHTLVRLKKYWSQLVSEIRTGDAWTSPQDLYKKIQQHREFLDTLI